MRIRFKHNLSALKKRISGRKKAMKAVRKEMEQISNKRAGQLRQGAPHNTGALRSGIRGTIKERKKGKGRVIEAGVIVPDLKGRYTGFPYVRFVFSLPGYEQIRTGDRNPFFAPNSVVSYGDGSTSPAGRPIRWTGVPGIYHTVVRGVKRDMQALRRRLKKQITKGVKT